MRPRALAFAVAGCAAVLALTWDIGRTSMPPTAGQHAPAAAPTRTASKDGADGGSEASTSPTAHATSRASHAPVSPSRRAPSGTVPGATADTQYGPVQVEIIVQHGRITDVKALQLTNLGGRSVAISRDAEPSLRTEALRAQSAKIDVVSGATYTSEGYRRSLQSAIDKAGL